MMRIFDINGQYFIGRPSSRDDYRRFLDQAEVVGLVLSGIDLKLSHSNDFPFISEFRTSNAQARDFIAELDDTRVVPFFFVDPRQADAARQVEQAARDGFRGIKMYPPQGWFPDEPRVLDAFRAAQEQDLPVFLHMGRTSAHPQLRSIYAMPARLEGMGLVCPRLKVILGHFAAPWSLEASALSKSFRFYFDLSTSGSLSTEAIRFAARCPDLGIERLVLGTNGTGANNMDLARGTVERLRVCGLSEEQIAKVASDNALALLGLDGAFARSQSAQVTGVNHAANR